MKLGDNLNSIASYYGIKIADLKADNNLDKDIVKEGDILLIRFKVDNPKVSKDVYRPPLKLATYEAAYVNRGPRCVGDCYVADPISTNTGNFYHEVTDVELQDFDKIALKRYYNSTGPKVSGMFGNTFTTPFEAYVAYDKAGNMLYSAGDGKLYKFNVSGSNYLVDKKYHFKVTKKSNKVTIIDDDNKITYVFNAYGVIESITPEGGKETRLTHDEYGFLTRMQSGDKVLTFQYNNRNLVTKVILPDGKALQYEYDTDRQLTKFLDTDNTSEIYHYKNGLISSVTDRAKKEIAQNTYDSKGRVLTQKDGNNQTTSFQYTGNKTKITDADGTVTTYTSDSYGRTASIESDDKKVDYQWDSKGNITKEIDQDGQSENYTYQGNDVTRIDYPDGTYETYTYNSNHQVLTHRDRKGKKESYVYQGTDVIKHNQLDGTILQYVYDNQHRVIQETNQFGDQKKYQYTGNQISQITHSNGLIQNYTFDKNGNVTSEKDNMGMHITYVYDARNRVTQKNYQDGTNEQWTYDGNSNVLQYKSRSNKVTTYTYDGNNNQLTSFDGKYYGKKVYDKKNRVISETGLNGLTKYYTYDSYDNVTVETDEFGNQTKHEFDSQNHEILVTDPQGNQTLKEYDFDRLVKSIDNKGLETTYEYDALNREISKTLPNGKKETKEYEGTNLKQTTDQYGTTTVYTYDEIGREIQNEVTYTDGEKIVSKKEYDKFGNLVKEIVNDVETLHTYDILKREIATTDGLGNTSYKEYDLEGNVIKETDALGNFSTKKYDVDKNIISETDKNGYTTTYTYNNYGEQLSQTDSLGNVTTLTYNEKGLLDTIVDPYEHQTKYTYDEYNRVIRLTLDEKIMEENTYDQYGNVIAKKTPSENMSYTFDSWNQKIAEKNNWTGLEKFYTYDKYGNMLVDKDSEGKTTEAVYDEYQRLIKTILPDERTTQQTYDVRGKVIETKAEDGTTTSVVYDVLGNVVKEIDQLGNEKTYTYDVLGRKIGEKTSRSELSFEYDKLGQEIATTDVLHQTKTTNVYDKMGNKISSTDAMGGVTKYVYDSKSQVIETIDALGNVTKQEYDIYGNVTKTIDALGNSTQTRYNAYNMKELEVDERGFTTQYIYNEDLQMIAEINKLGGETRYFYNDANQVVETMDPRGHTIQYEYDAYGRQVKEIVENGFAKIKQYDIADRVVLEKEGKRSSKTVYDERGNIVKQIKNGKTIESNTYNEFNQKVSSKDVLGYESSYEYDRYGQVIHEDVKGYIRDFEYDDYGNVIKQSDNQSFIQTTKYDELQRVVETKTNGVTTRAIVYDAVGNEIEIVENGIYKRMEYDALQHMQALYIKNKDNTGEVALQRFEYDERGNVIREIDSDDHELVYTYNAIDKVTSKKDKKGSLNIMEYDSLGNVTKVNNGISRQVEYTYNLDNQLIYKKTGSQVIAYSYDKYGNKIKEEDEFGYVTKYRYDLDGNQISKKKPDGKKIRYRYNKANQVVRENKRTYTYDERGNKTSAKDKQGIVRFEYDAFNKLIEVQDTNKESVVYEYDENQRIIAKEYGGEKINYSYDEYGNLKDVKTGDKEIASYTYNHRGEVITLKQGAAVTSKTYDDMGRTITQRTKKDKKVVFEANYQYDANDNIVEETINGLTNTYQYDEYDELKESNKYVNEKFIKTKYDQDMMGNQIVTSSNDGITKYVYNEKHQLTTIDSDKDYTKLYYDKNGNLVNKVHQDGENETYKYDIYNQLIQMKQDHYIYDYTYDASSVRTKQVRTDTKDYHEEKWYDYDVSLSSKMPTSKERDDAFDILFQQAQLKEDNANSCALKEEESYDYVYQKDKEVTAYTVDRSVENTQVLLTNDTVNIYGDESLLQSNEEVIIHGLNESVMASLKGNKVKTYSYQDYGASKKSGYGYNGEEKDKNGLIYLRARYYDPELARFIQIDNQYEGETDAVNTQNKYIYTLNNPYKYVDRDGLKSKKKNPKVVDTVVKNSASGTTYTTIFSNGTRKTTFIPKKVKKFEAPPDLSNKKLLNSVVSYTEPYWKDPPRVATSSNRTPKAGSSSVTHGYKRPRVKCKATAKDFGKLIDNSVKFAQDAWDAAAKHLSNAWNSLGEFITHIGDVDWWKEQLANIDWGDLVVRAAACVAVSLALSTMSLGVIGTLSFHAVAGQGASLLRKVVKSDFNMDKLYKTMGVDNFAGLVGVEVSDILMQVTGGVVGLKVKAKIKGASGAKTPKTKAEILAENRANGRAFEVEKIGAFKKVANNVEEQITLVTKDGTKVRVDAIGYDKTTGKLIIQEYKSSATAPLTKNQDLGFPQITESGAIVVGKGKGIFINGVEIPPGTEINIIRPK